MSTSSGVTPTVYSPTSVLPSSSPPPPTPPSAPSSRFSSDDEIKKFAKEFIGRRIDSLVRDVDHCLTSPFAPFPAILYCMSTIEMMGALIEGEAARMVPDIDPSTGRPRLNSAGRPLERPASTTANTKKYMRDYMHYTSTQATLILALFRHKLAHLAQPKFIFKYNGDVISWHYEHDDNGKHLTLVPAISGAVVTVKPGWDLAITKVFTIGIKQFVRDIKNSVCGTNGYFDRMDNTLVLRDNFVVAIGQIYNDAD